MKNVAISAELVFVAPQIATALRDKNFKCCRNGIAMIAEISLDSVLRGGGAKGSLWSYRSERASVAGAFAGIMYFAQRVRSKAGPARHRVVPNKRHRSCAPRTENRTAQRRSDRRCRDTRSRGYDRLEECGTGCAARSLRSMSRLRMGEAVGHAAAHFARSVSRRSFPRWMPSLIRFWTSSGRGPRRRSLGRAP